MGTCARPRPKRLAAKLLELRQKLHFTQAEMIEALKLETSTARIHEYEAGTGGPNLLVILAYARAARVPVEYLIDDDL